MLTLPSPSARQYHFGERDARSRNYDAAAYQLSDAALAQLEELVQLRRTVFVSFGACVAFFVLGAHPRLEPRVTEAAAHCTRGGSPPC